MSTTLTDLLGEHLVEHDSTDQAKTKEIPTKQFDGKYVGLYFSAHWCGPCRNFTPKLVEQYKKSHEELKDKFEIIFISWDEDQAGFDEYYREMPWKALPFADRERSEKLGEQFQVQGIPSLVVLTPSGEKLTVNGTDEMQIAPDKVLQLWSQGKTLFWSAQPKEGEHSWEDVTCKKCYMNPIVGHRYGCEDRKCAVSLCQTCATNYEHEHPLVQFLTPKKAYKLEELFQSVPFLLQPNDEEQLPTNSLWNNDVKAVGIYFSAHWCPPCRHFTPQLAELYKEAAVTTSSPFRLVFVSCDRDDESFNEYRSTMPWPAVPLRNGTLLKEYFQFSGIPSLFILSSDGKILTRSGRNDISAKGVEAIKTWAKGEKVPPAPPGEFVWAGVSCDGCQTSPLIGQRYYCATCGNYDLCSACQQKGHEHELKLVPQPNGDDD